MDENITTKVCRKCGREMPISMFSINKQSKDGHASYCKPCQAEYDRIRAVRKKEEKKRIREEAQRLADAMPESDSITLSDGKVLRKVDKNCKPLCEYDPVELLAELKRRGYVWADMYAKVRVDYNKI